MRAFWRKTETMYSDQATLKPMGRPHLLVLPGIIWLSLFGLAPLVLMVVMSFWRSTIFGTYPDFSFHNYAQLFGVALYRNLIFKTLRIAITTTLLTLVISYPVAYYLSLLKGIWKTVFVLLMFLPFWTSYVVRTFVWLPILGRHGAVNQLLIALGIIDQPLEWLLYNEFSLYLGLVYVYTLFMTLPIYLSLEKIDHKLIEAAIDLVARPYNIFIRVLLPLSRPGILAGCIMVFLLAVSAFVTPQLLGGPSGIMYGNMVASQFLSNNNWAFGATLSVTLIAIIMILLMITKRWIGVQEVFTGGRS